MGQFKYNVKMMSSEPSVVLKLKKGGHVNKKATAKAEHGHKPMHKVDGGVMGALARTPALIGRPAVNAPVRVPARPPLVARRRAMAAMPSAVMKKGGKAHHHAEGGETRAEHQAEMKKLSHIEHELKAHEHKKAKAAHHGLKHGGKVHHKSTGGDIPAERHHGSYAETEMDEATHDSARGTGEVKVGKPGGYKRGGKVHRKATGGMIPSAKHYGSYETTEVDEAEHDSAHGTGGVRMGNAGGFKRGGKAHRKAKGGLSYVDGNVTTSHPGVTNTKTGSVVEGKPGGYRKGGAAKKYADGGRVEDSGRAVKMPQGYKKPSPPVAINQLSGTFKKGGHVKHKAGGGSMDENAAYERWKANERAENRADREAMSNLPSKLMDLGSRAVQKIGDTVRGLGGVTNTVREVSKTVIPAKQKRGGMCK